METEMILDKSQGARDPFSRPLSILLIAAWFGLFTGLAEALFLVLYRQQLRGNIISQSKQIFWMAPVSEIAIFSLLGGVFALGARLSPRLIRPRLVLFSFAFLSCVAFLLLFPQLHSWAVLLLAAGVGAQTARLLAARPRFFVKLVRYSAPLLVVLVLGLAIGIQGWQIWSERQALSQLPLAREGAPNVMLIVLDTVGASALSVYGYGRPTTPELERFARRGVVFENAISTAPWTLPSHASMFTGRLPNEMSFGMKTPLRTSSPTLAEVLRDHGYASAGFVANLQYCNYEDGLSTGMVHYSDYPVTPGQIFISATLGRAISKSWRLRKVIGNHEDLNRKNAEVINQEFLSWYSRNNQRPFFAFLNYFDAHRPYLPPAPFRGKFGPSHPRVLELISDEDAADEDFFKLHPEVKQPERDAYDESIAYLDKQLGVLFSELEKRGGLENTLVIITSDHGEHFGEHALYGHGNSLYLPLLHVPLIVVFPKRVPPGVRVPNTVSLRDIPASVLDLIGIESSRQFPGNVLSRYWVQPAGSNQRATEFAYSEDPAWYPGARGDGKFKSLVLGQYHYIRNGDGSEELYNWQNDKQETNNLEKTIVGKLEVERARAVLTTQLARK